MSKTKEPKITDTDKALNDVKEQTTSKARKPRKKVYERIQETDLPEDLVAHFKLDNYDLRLKRWSILGDEDYRYLTQCENEGYEFVHVDELTESFLASVRIMDTRGRKGLVIIGDLCLMKMDCDLTKSRKKYFEDKTAQQLDAVSMHVLNKKHGFQDLGTRSKVLMKEPTFQE
jgi:hypothetical protein